LPFEACALVLQCNSNSNSNSLGSVNPSITNQTALQETAHCPRSASTTSATPACPGDNKDTLGLLSATNPKAPKSTQGAGTPSRATKTHIGTRRQCTARKKDGLHPHTMLCTRIPCFAPAYHALHPHTMLCTRVAPMLVLEKLEPRRINDRIEYNPGVRGRSPNQP
jgi:hypothetical protein